MPWPPISCERFERYGHADRAARDLFSIALTSAWSPAASWPTLSRIVNRIKSKLRSRVEQVFAVVKRQFGFAKLRYRGLAKNATRAFVALGLANIYLARGRLAG